MSTRRPFEARTLLAATLLVSALLVSQAKSGESGADLISLIEEESTVESASRHPQSLADAPANVTIITARFVAPLASPRASLSGKNIFNEGHFESAGPEHVQETLPQGKRTLILKAGWGP